LCNSLVCAAAQFCGRLDLPAIIPPCPCESSRLAKTDCPAVLSAGVDAPGRGLICLVGGSAGAGMTSRSPARTFAEDMIDHGHRRMAKFRPPDQMEFMHPMFLVPAGKPAELVFHEPVTQPSRVAVLLTFLRYGNEMSILCGTAASAVGQPAGLAEPRRVRAPHATATLPPSGTRYCPDARTSLGNSLWHRDAAKPMPTPPSGRAFPIVRAIRWPGRHELAPPDLGAAPRLPQIYEHPWWRRPAT
jgi:hypothetical protein